MRFESAQQELDCVGAVAVMTVGVTWALCFSRVALSLGWALKFQMVYSVFSFCPPSASSHLYTTLPPRVPPGPSWMGSAYYSVLVWQVVA